MSDTATATAYEVTVTEGGNEWIYRCESATSPADAKRQARAFFGLDAKIGKAVRA